MLTAVREVIAVPMLTIASIIIHGGILRTFPVSQPRVVFALVEVLQEELQDITLDIGQIDLVDILYSVTCQLCSTDGNRTGDRPFR